MNTEGLPTMQWLLVPPKGLIQNVLLTVGKAPSERRIEFGWVDKDKAMHNAVAYMIVPHFYDEPNEWKSEYKDDELPTESGEFICCTECKYNNRLHVHCYYYNSRTYKFGGVEALAYMEKPKPYSGKKVLSY